MRNLILQEAEEATKIDKHELDEENVRHPQLIFATTQQLAAANLRKGQADKLVERIYAELDATLRKQAADTETKLSETQLKMKISLMPKMKDAEDDLLDAIREAEQWWGALEALKAKGFALRGLGELHNTNYFAAETSGKASREHVTQLADKNREEAGRVRRVQRQNG